MGKGAFAPPPGKCCKVLLCCKCCLRSQYTKYWCIYQAFIMRSVMSQINQYDDDDYYYYFEKMMSASRVFAPPRPLDSLGGNYILYTPSLPTPGKNPASAHAHPSLIFRIAYEQTWSQTYDLNCLINCRIQLLTPNSLERYLMTYMP